MIGFRLASSKLKLCARIDRFRTPLNNCINKQQYRLFIVSATTDQNDSGKNDDIPLYSIGINTCSNLYSAQYKVKINRSKPLTGVNFNVVYADTRPNVSVPVILALHGVAGSHRNFLPLLPYLLQGNARVLMPNFPGCGFTALDTHNAFTHSVEEKTCFIMDFLEALNVNRVQVLVTHSAAIYTALALCRESSMFKSLVLINPGGVQPVSAMKPLFLYRLLLKLHNLPVVRQVVNLFLSVLIMNKKLSFLKFSRETLEVAAWSMLFVDFDKMRHVLAEIILRFPTVLALCRNDPIVNPSVNQELIELFDFNEDSLFHHDGKGLVVTSGKDVMDAVYPRGFVFDDGSHFLMKAFPEILAREILNLYSFVERNPYYGKNSLSTR